MKVLKFGGTSVGSVESLRNVKRIVESSHDEQLIVVVSALGGFTDKLIATAKAAEAADSNYVNELPAMKQRHIDIVNELVPPAMREELIAEINELFTQLAKVYQGIYLLEELSTRSLDRVVSFGERLSSRIVARIITGAHLFDSTRFIRTLRRFDKHVLDVEVTHNLIHDTFYDIGFKVAVVPGFISTDINGVFTNLGRGGSDYTAAILAAELNAEVLEIWTDVDGFMTADPRIIPNAKVIPSLSFIEAMELCNFGAKVIYPPTIYPVFHKNIPIYIKNTFNPEAPGTCINDNKNADTASFSTKGVTSIQESCLITLSGPLHSKAIVTRALNTMARNGVSVLLVETARGKASTSFAIAGNDSERAAGALEKEFAAEMETGDLNPVDTTRNLSTIAIVGEGMRQEDNLPQDVAQATDNAGICTLAFSQGIPETSISFVVNRDQREAALLAVHNSLFE